MSVDLPLPDAPTTATNSPRSTVRSTPRSACTVTSPRTYDFLSVLEPDDRRVGHGQRCRRGGRSGSERVVGGRRAGRARAGRRGGGALEAGDHQRALRRGRPSPRRTARRRGPISHAGGLGLAWSAPSRKTSDRLPSRPRGAPASRGAARRRRSAARGGLHGPAAAGLPPGLPSAARGAGPPPPRRPPGSSNPSGRKRRAEAGRRSTFSALRTMIETVAVMPGISFCSALSTLMIVL